MHFRHAVGRVPPSSLPSAIRCVMALLCIGRTKPIANNKLFPAPNPEKRKGDFFFVVAWEFFFPTKSHILRTWTWAVDWTPTQSRF